MPTVLGTMTVEQLLARMATLAREETRLHQEYVRLGAELHDRLQGDDHVIARGHARPTLAATPPAERQLDLGNR